MIFQNYVTSCDVATRRSYGVIIVIVYRLLYFADFYSTFFRVHLFLIIMSDQRSVIFYILLISIDDCLCCNGMSAVVFKLVGGKKWIL